MRPDGVVLLPPTLDQDFGLQQRVKDLPLQKLVPVTEPDDSETMTCQLASRTQPMLIVTEDERVTIFISSTLDVDRGKLRHCLARLRSLSALRLAPICCLFGCSQQTQ